MQCILNQSMGGITQHVFIIDRPCLITTNISLTELCSSWLNYKIKRQNHARIITLVYLPGSSALHMLQNNNGKQTLQPCIMTCFCGYSHHAPGAQHAWKLFGLAKKLSSVTSIQKVWAKFTTLINIYSPLLNFDCVYLIVSKEEIFHLRYFDPNALGKLQIDNGMLI